MRRRRTRPLAAGAVALACVAGLLALGLGACSSSDAAPPAKAGRPTTWTVCTDVPYAPFEVPGDGPRGLRYTGFDIEVLDAVAKARNARLRIRPSDFDTILRDVAFGRCDVVAAAVAANQERRQQVDFSSSYFDADQSLLVRRGAQGRRLEDLEGATIGVESGTIASWWARRRLPDGASIRRFPDARSLHAALDDGTIDAAIADLAVNTARAKADRKVELVELLHTGEHFAFAVAPDDDAVRKEIDTGLEAIRADGTYDRLLRRYFPYPTDAAHP
ncbi:MAG: ABC transporter substrate-binding protein [Acidimicrobiales bacterium]